MGNFEIIIVIPVYKAIASIEEKASFSQCLRVLSRHEICLVCYENMDCSWYKKIAKTEGVLLSIVTFDEHYFQNLGGYNRLMMSKYFYQKFAQYKYLLIYQLDAWVFSDALDDWCRKGYDYVGAPWFTDNGNHENGNELWAVGNGGLSLRRVKCFIDLFENNEYDYSFAKILKLCLRGHFIKRKRFKTLIDEWNDAEDLFFCLKLRGTGLELKIPDCNEAIGFAFEQSPEYLFQILGHLPFGCHAWNRYGGVFWEKYISGKCGR